MERVILANELAEPAAVPVDRERARSRPYPSISTVLSTPAAGVRLLESILSDARLSRRLQVLLEVGPPGGRAGCRTREQALDVAPRSRRIGTPGARRRRSVRRRDRRPQFACHSPGR